VRCSSSLRGPCRALFRHLRRMNDQILPKTRSLGTNQASNPPAVRCVVICRWDALPLDWTLPNQSLQLRKMVVESAIKYEIRNHSLLQSPFASAVLVSNSVATVEEHSAKHTDEDVSKLYIPMELQGDWLSGEITRTEMTYNSSVRDMDECLYDLLEKPP